MTLTPETLALIGATFLLAGSVKGVIGLGLPSVSLGVLAATLDLPTAMALMVMPSLATNLWQGLVGGHLKSLVVRLWPFFLAATVTVWLGAIALSSVDLEHLSGLLGVLLAIYAGVALVGWRLTFAPQSEKWAGPGFGLVNGILTGMTGSFVMPGVLFLQAIGLPRDALVQAMGILFTLSTIALAIALQRQAFLTADLGLVSLASIIPALIGMVLGQRLRSKLSETAFRRVFFWSLLVLGLYIIARAAGV